MKFKGHLRYYWLLIAGLLCIGFALLSERWIAGTLTDFTFKHKARLAQETIPVKDTLADRLLQRLALYSDHPTPEESTYLFHESEHKNIFLYVVENREVTYWTS